MPRVASAARQRPFRHGGQRRLDVAGPEEITERIAHAVLHAVPRP